MNVSENFTIEELIATSKPFDNTPTFKETVNLCRLVFYFLQPLRNKLGKAITITCGLRMDKVNTASGGTKRSQHLTGNAVDINCKEMSKLDLFKFIANTMKFDQLIYEVDANCLHVSFVSEKENRNQILLRKVINKEKVYYEYSPEELKRLESV